MTKTAKQPKTKRRYNSKKAAETRRINKERRKKGLPTLAEQDRIDRPRRPYSRTMRFAGKNGTFREFRGELGINAKEWRKFSKYAHRVKEKKKSASSDSSNGEKAVNDEDVVYEV